MSAPSFIPSTCNDSIALPFSGLQSFIPISLFVIVTLASWFIRWMSFWPGATVAQSFREFPQRRMLNRYKRRPAEKAITRFDLSIKGRRLTQIADPAVRPPFKFPRCHLKPCLNRSLIPAEPSGEIIKGGSHKPRIMPRLGCLCAASVFLLLHSFLSVATRAFGHLIKTISAERRDSVTATYCLNIFERLNRSLLTTSVVDFLKNPRDRRNDSSTTALKFLPVRASDTRGSLGSLSGKKFVICAGIVLNTVIFWWRGIFFGELVWKLLEGRMYIRVSSGNVNLTFRDLMIMK